MIRRLSPLFFVFLAPLYSYILLAQVQPLGAIGGQLRIVRGDTPSNQILVELRLHGAAVNNVYTDVQGRFSFSNLDPDSYHIVIHDEAYDAIDESVELRPESPIANLAIFLRPREESKKVDPLGTRVSGGNPFLVDPGDYNKRFPKKAVKQYSKGLDADREGDREKAISHYQAALTIAPDYYPAHNNLGSDYLKNSDFVDARREFQEVIRLNQSGAAAYFNLSNVCLMMGQMADAQGYLDEGRRREPDSALGFFLLGSLNMRTGKYQEAESALRRAIQARPAMAQARLQLINLLLRLGRSSEAKVELRDFISAFPDSAFTPKAKQLLVRLEGTRRVESHD